MSYDIILWKWKKDAEPNATVTYAVLCEGLPAPETAPLDVVLVEEALDRLCPAWEDASTHFTFTTTESHVAVESHHGRSAEHAIAVATELARELSLELFDPQQTPLSAQDEELAQASITRLKDEASDDLVVFLKLAESGDIDALNSVGNCYAFGEGVSEDHGEAVKWYGRAAAKGHVGATINLAECYREGTGVSRDATRAVKLYERAAKSDKLVSVFALAEMYSSGEGVERDLDEARRLYRIALEHRHPDAKTALRELDEL